MDPTITVERLKIYNKYKGDIDGFVRVGRNGEKKVFEPDLGKVWSTISSKIQDVDLIKTGLVSEAYKQKIINDLKISCDANSFNNLIKGLSL